MSLDLHAHVTNAIIAALEAGAGQWVRPWHSQRGGLPRNGITQRPYGGCNILILWTAAIEKGYTSPQWASYRQWEQAGRQVRKGEKSTLIAFYGKATRTRENQNGEPEEQSYYYAKPIWVFNAAQLTDGEGEPPTQEVSNLKETTAAREAVAATGARIEHGGDRAFYSPAQDFIRMPHQSAFVAPCPPEDRYLSSLKSYFSTLLHELVHWTGHESRLNRKFAAFGTETYAREELVAELGSAFLCAELGLSSEPRADHAQYLAAWLKILKDDKKAIFSAASAASAAAAHILAYRQNIKKAA